MDNSEDIKNNAKKVWSGFAPLENLTGTAAPRLIKFANINKNQKILDVACGTGVVALTAARTGANVFGSDLTPELLERAEENNKLFKLSVKFTEADVEKLPYDDAFFDVVLSQFGHMFAPNPEKALSEMLRVLKPGGTIAFSTWPPELFMGQFFQIISKYNPPLSSDFSPPHLWGNVDVVIKRLENRVDEIKFDRDKIISPGLSISHLLGMFEKGAGPLSKLIEKLSSDPERLYLLRTEILNTISLYFENNSLRQDYLLTKGIKK